MIIPTNDVATSKTFYTAVFGWSYQDWGPDYADTAGSGVGSGLNADESHKPRSPLVLMYATDLEAALSRVVAAGGTITRDIFSYPGGRRFHFTDPSGNELGVYPEG